MNVAPLLLNCDVMSAKVPVPPPLDRIMLCKKVLPSANVDGSINPAAIAFEKSIVAGEADGSAELRLVSAPPLSLCAVELAFDDRPGGNVGRSAETFGEAQSYRVERLTETSDSETADEADEGARLWLASAPSRPVCAMEFTFDRRTGENVGRSAETFGETASYCVERLTETSDSETADETDEGAGLWLASAPSRPVCAMEFAFDCRTGENVGNSAETFGEA